ncbi:2-alkenal reductase (NADP(+)-dependent)-like, partial [Olea europaea subsp. europaea]
MGSEEVGNRQIILNDYIKGFPKESDMSLKTSSIKLKVPADSPNAIMVKNLYLSCDPYMRNRMQKTEGSYVEPFTPGTPIVGYGVSKVVDSAHLNFKVGDLVWGMTGWEEYSLIKDPETLIKIRHTDVPLSYYTGILGSYIFKDLCTVKRKHRVKKTAFFTEQVSMVIEKNVLAKYKDPGCPTMSCTIGNHEFAQALLNLGASVNIMPYAIYSALGLGEIKPTSMILQLAYRSTIKPKGVVEDVLVQIDNFLLSRGFL